MSVAFDTLLNSPRLKFYFDRISDCLQKEHAARIRFREEMNEDTRAEFINGKVFMHSPAKFIHNTTAERIFEILKSFVRYNGLGHVGHEKYLVELTRNDVEPDVIFWQKAKSELFKNHQLLFPPPDLAIEVLSPSTEAIDRGTKFEDYAAHGVTEYWIVDPDQRTLEQYLLNGENYELKLKSGNGKVTSTAIVGGVFLIEAFFDDELARRELVAK